MKRSIRHTFVILLIVAFLPLQPLVSSPNPTLTVGKSEEPVMKLQDVSSSPLDLDKFIIPSSAAD